MATSKEHFYLLNSSGQLESGAVLTTRAVNGGVTLHTFTEPDNIAHPGLYVLVADTGLYDIYKNGVKQAYISPWLHIDSDVLPQAVASNIDMFGDGTDGTYVLDGTQAAVAGLFTKSGSVYTLSRDAFFSTLTANNTVTLKTNGFRLFVKVHLINNGTIANVGVNGNNGGNASGANAGAGGTFSKGAPGGYLRGDLGDTERTGVGGNGGAVDVNGSNGGNATSLSNIIGNVGRTGVSGGANGNGSHTGGSGGTGPGSGLAGASGGMHNVLQAVMNRAFSDTAIAWVGYHCNNGGSGGGAGGPAASSVAGGGGGSAGGNGGIMVVCANLVTGNGTFTVTGGVGGNGGNGSNNGTVGGGGGGAGHGGNGGWLIEVVRTDSAFTGTWVVTGANPGSVGLGGGIGVVAQPGVSGSAGSVGITGAYWRFAV
jgi:hypothetical protein